MSFAQDKRPVDIGDLVHAWLATPEPTRNDTTSLAFLPWRVTLWVMDSLLSNEYRPVSYMIRCPRGPAAAIAERLWKRWEKDEKGKGGDIYPDVMGRGHVCLLDNGDWKGYLKDAIRHGRDKNLEMCLLTPFPTPMAWTVPGMVFDLERSMEPDEQDYEVVKTDLLRLNGSAKHS